MVRNGIDLDTPEIHAFRRKWKIRNLYVFGSYLRDDFTPDSDIDFLVEFEEGESWTLSDLSRMSDGLSIIVGRRVDLIERAAIEADRNPYLREEILGTAEAINANR